MFFTFIIVVILTAIVLVVVAMTIAKFTCSTVIQSAEGRTVRMWYSYAWTIMGAIQGRLLPVCYLVPDVRH